MRWNCKCRSGHSLVNARVLVRPGFWNRTRVIDWFWLIKTPARDILIPIQHINNNEYWAYTRRGRARNKPVSKSRVGLESRVICHGVVADCIWFVAETIYYNHASSSQRHRDDTCHQRGYVCVWLSAVFEHNSQIWKHVCQSESLRCRHEQKFQG